MTVRSSPRGGYVGSAVRAECSPSLAKPEQMRSHENESTDACAYQRSVHADVLQVAADHEFQAIGQCPCVPPVHHLLDDAGDLAALHHQGKRQALYAGVHMHEHGLVGGKHARHGTDRLFERRAGSRRGSVDAVEGEFR